MFLLIKTQSKRCSSLYGHVRCLFVCLVWTISLLYVETLAVVVGKKSLGLVCVDVLVLAAAHVTLGQVDGHSFLLLVWVSCAHNPHVFWTICSQYRGANAICPVTNKCPCPTHHGWLEDELRGTISWDNNDDKEYGCYNQNNYDRGAWLSCGVFFVWYERQALGTAFARRKMFTTRSIYMICCPTIQPLCKVPLFIFMTIITMTVAPAAGIVLSFYGSTVVPFWRATCKATWNMPSMWAWPWVVMSFYLTIDSFRMSHMWMINFGIRPWRIDMWHKYETLHRTKPFCGGFRPVRAWQSG